MLCYVMLLCVYWFGVSVVVMCFEYMFCVYVTGVRYINVRVRGLVGRDRWFE